MSGSSTAEILAAFALIRAYTARDLFTTANILVRWAGNPEHGEFAAVVASAAAEALTRQAGDRDKALRAADDILGVYLSMRAAQLTGRAS
jgi:hypothetical protein